MVQPPVNRRAILVAGLSMGALTAAPGAMACGFENPALLQKGILNWIYPKALYVESAVWRAQLAGLVDREPQLRATRMFINPGYRKAVKALEAFANRLPAGSGEQQSSFVVLLMEAMLWTRIHPGGLAPVKPHVNGTEPGEALLITHRVVLDALNIGRISAREACELGLFRLYGEGGAVAGLAALLGADVAAVTAELQAR